MSEASQDAAALSPLLILLRAFDMARKAKVLQPAPACEVDSIEQAAFLAAAEESDTK